MSTIVEHAPAAEARPATATPLSAESLRRDFRCYRAPWAWAITQRVLAVTALVAALPFLAILRIVMLIASPGPFLFCQRRLGRMGHSFTIYKIRTMSVGSETVTALGVQPHDPTVTSLGRLLRYLKIDEIPQLWNVARGDMELIGPRPLPVALEERIQTFLPAFMIRHVVSPGLMNPAQFVDSDIVPESELRQEWSRRFQQELESIHRKSVPYDLQVLLAAVFYLGARYTGVAALLCTPTPARLPVHRERRRDESAPQAAERRDGGDRRGADAAVLPTPIERRALREADIVQLPTAKAASTTKPQPASAH